MFYGVIGFGIIVAAIVVFLIYLFVKSHPPRRRSGDNKQGIKW